MTDLYNLFKEINLSFRERLCPSPFDCYCGRSLLIFLLSFSLCLFHVLWSFVRGRGDAESCVVRLRRGATDGCWRASALAFTRPVIALGRLDGEKWAVIKYLCSLCFVNRSSALRFRRKRSPLFHGTVTVLAKNGFIFSEYRPASVALLTNFALRRRLPLVMVLKITTF